MLYWSKFKLKTKTCEKTFFKRIYIKSQYIFFSQYESIQYCKYRELFHISHGIPKSSVGGSWLPFFLERCSTVVCRRRRVPPPPLMDTLLRGMLCYSLDGDPINRQWQWPSFSWTTGQSGCAAFILVQPVETIHCQCWPKTTTRLCADVTSPQPMPCWCSICCNHYLLCVLLKKYKNHLQTHPASLEKISWRNNVLTTRFGELDR